MKLLKAMMVGAAMIVAGSAVAEDYNRIGLSYDYTYYTEPVATSTNGFGLNYMHGFSISKSHPMFIELGASLGFNFHGDSEWDDDEDELVKSQFQNFNVKVPVNFTWRFRLGDNFYVSPFAGLNFQLNYIERERVGVAGIWSDWENMLDDDYGWNVFQMGWQAGLNFQYDQVLLGAQIGTSFIPSYHESFAGYNVNVHNTCFKLTLGYEF